MAVRSRFTRLDAFAKTVEDARVRTTSGGIVTIVSLLLILYLVWGEWSDYRRITLHPELVVDKGRGEKMEIHMNITFPRMPCELLTLDVMDVSGEVQAEVMAGITKTRLSHFSEGSRPIDTKALDLHPETEKGPHLDPGYCGSCYSADAPEDAIKPGCCNTCDEVRNAYAAKQWAFGRGEGVEQCEREHYSQHLDEQRREGCRIAGGIRVNKVVGNFHFAPGKSMSQGNAHVHDLKNYAESVEPHSFSHEIHTLRFGPPLPQNIVTKLGGLSGLAATNQHLSPLDGTGQLTDVKPFNFMYFIKVVPTAFLPLGWDKPGMGLGSTGQKPNSQVELGEYGQGAYGNVETHQYSVTSHRRNIGGGNAKDEGHQERVHAYGGIPGVFFSYDISPMKVINKEERTKSFSAFLVGVCAVIGGTLTVAAAIDRGLYEGGRRINKMKDG